MIHALESIARPFKNSFTPFPDIEAARTNRQATESILEERVNG